MADTSVMSSIFLRVVCGLHLTHVHWLCLKRQEENTVYERAKKGGKKLELQHVYKLSLQPTCV